MMKSSRLLHPLFLISIAILLVNDFYLKAALHNSLTGKLSDVSGLLAVGVCSISLFPSHKKKALIFIAIFFCWWKSPLSTGFLYFINDSLGLHYQRVVDYTDLLCLPVLLLSVYVKPVTFHQPGLQTAAVWSVAAVSFFSFCATSEYRHLYYTPYRDNEIYYNESFSTALSPQQVLEKLNPSGAACQQDSVRYYSVLKGDELVYRVNNGIDSAAYWVPATNNNDSSLFVKRSTSPYYIIPYIYTGTDTLFNTEVHISKGDGRKKMTFVQVYSYRLNPQRGDIYDRAVHDRKSIRKYFKRILKEKP